MVNSGSLYGPICKGYPDPYTFPECDFISVHQVSSADENSRYILTVNAGARPLAHLFMIMQLSSTPIGVSVSDLELAMHA